MQLYHSPTSPFVRAVMLVIHELGLSEQITLRPASGSALDPGTAPVAQNPLGKVPTLMLEDGSALYDSRVISRYLAREFGPHLLPQSPQAETLEALANGMMDAAYLMVMEQRLRPQEAQFTPWIEGQWAKIARSLDHLEAQGDGNSPDGGPLVAPLSTAQLALAASLGYLDLRLEDRNWRAGRPALAAWHAEIAARPAYGASAPPQ